MYGSALGADRDARVGAVVSAPASATGVFVLALLAMVALPPALAMLLVLAVVASPFRGFRRRRRRFGQEDGFGHGKVLASPFDMALVAAALAVGKTPVPRLVEGKPTTIAGHDAPITAKMLDGLRPMMQLVTDGTAEDIADCGAVLDKTRGGRNPGRIALLVRRLPG